MKRPSTETNLNRRVPDLAILYLLPRSRLHRPHRRQRSLRASRRTSARDDSAIFSSGRRLLDRRARRLARLVLLRAARPPGVSVIEPYFSSPPMVP